jgi:hypothetical protein
MAITLNGTTGITTPDLTSAAPMDVGGSAVLTAASSLAAANLTGALPASAMPSGSVLQVKYATWGTATTITTTGVKDLFSGTITVQNGSRCVLMSKVEKYAANSGSWPNVWTTIFKQNGTQLSTSETEHVGLNTTSADSNTYANLFVTDVLTAGAYTFMVSGNMIGAGTHQFNRSPRTSHLVMMEVVA